MPLEPRKFLGFATPTGGLVSAKPTEAKDDEVMMAMPLTQPVTKVEIEKCRKKLTFAESADSDEIIAEESAAEKSSESNVYAILDQVLIPKEESRSATPPSSGLGTPSTVMGITRLNASTKPLRKEKRSTDPKKQLFVRKRPKR